MAKGKTHKKTLRSLAAIGFFMAGIFAYPFLTKYGFTSTNNKPFAAITHPISLSPAVPTATKSEIENLGVCFTPNQPNSPPCLPQILRHIDKAQSSILLLGYSFTSKPLTDALIKAKNRGVKIRIVLDHSQQTQKASKEPIEALIKNQIEIRFDHSVKIAHNKVIIIDNHQTITGSYNWSHAAEFKNAENLVFIGSQAVTKKYTDYFEERWKSSKTNSHVQTSYQKTIGKKEKPKKNTLIRYFKSP